MKPLISVAMTTYNGEKYIKKQLDSILNQTYDNIELVVCDDCSSDKTVDILEEYSKQYKNIRFYKNEGNLGFTKNFEKAISMCNGEYIVLSDQDDIWELDKIDLLLKNIGDKKVAFSKYSAIDENDNYIYENPPFFDEIKRRFLNTKNDYKNILLFNNFVTGCTMMIKRDFTEKFIPIPKEIYHDWWIAYIAAQDNELVYVDKPLIKYRLHTNNETASGRITGNNNKEFGRFQKISAIIFNKDYLTKKNKNINKQIKFQNILKSQEFISQADRDKLAKIILMNQSIIKPELNIENLKSLFFEFKNRKYLSSKNGYFLFSILTRFLNIINFKNKGEQSVN